MIRLATPADAQAVHDIYAPIVRETAISFEWDVPSVQELRRRIEGILDGGYPWLVTIEAGTVTGYAYGSRFRARAAYDWSVEVSIYVQKTHRGRGVGRALYERLLRVLALQGFRGAYGVATATNPSSESLHRSLGFTPVGRFPDVGYKFGRWHDVIVWHKPLGESDDAPGAIRGVHDVLGDAR